MTCLVHDSDRSNLSALAHRLARRWAFTLIELLVVTALISILAAMLPTSPSKANPPVLQARSAPKAAT